MSLMLEETRLPLLRDVTWEHRKASLDGRYSMATVATVSTALVSAIPRGRGALMSVSSLVLVLVLEGELKLKFPSDLGVRKRTTHNSWNKVVLIDGQGHWNRACGKQRNISKLDSTRPHPSKVGPSSQEVALNVLNFWGYGYVTFASAPDSETNVVKAGPKCLVSRDARK